MGKIETFKKLEKLLGDRSGSVALLKSKEESSKGEIAIMHIFSENFSGNWLSGDGILFWEDGEVTSADDDHRFEILDILLPPYNRKGHE